MLQLNEIGFVKSSFKQHADPLVMQKHVSYVIIREEYEKGLEKIEEKSYLQILYRFHLCDECFKLSDDTYSGMSQGIFASRSTGRPNNIGLTTVKLIKKNKNILTVIGLDALDGSPILDIKPYNPKLDFRLISPYLTN